MVWLVVRERYTQAVPYQVLIEIYSICETLGPCYVLIYIPTSVPMEQESPSRW